MLGSCQRSLTISLRSLARSRVIRSMKKSTVQIIVMTKTSTIVAVEVSMVRTRLRRRFFKTSTNRRKLTTKNARPDRTTIAEMMAQTSVAGSSRSNSTKRMGYLPRSARDIRIARHVCGLGFEHFRLDELAFFQVDDALGP